MSPVILAGVVVVNLALVGYTVGVILARKRHVTQGTVVAFTVAVVLDLVATACMMIGATRTWFTPHGVVGFAALAAMLVLLPFLWRARRRSADGLMSEGLYVFMWVAYLAWVATYIIGATRAMNR